MGLADRNGVASRRKIVTLGVAVFVLSICVSGYAQENNENLKSVDLATALWLDPIPGGALAYSGHYGQATGSFLMGTTGLITSFFGVIISAMGCESGQSCEYNGELVLGSGVAAYLGSLIWDGVMGVKYVKEQKTGLDLSQFPRPTLDITPDSVLATATWVF